MLSRLNSSSCLDDNAGAASDDPTSVAASDDPTSVAAAWSAAPNPTYYAADAILEDPSWFLSSGGGGAHYADPFSFMEVGPAATTMSAFSFESSDPMPSSSDLMFSGFGSGLHDFNPMSFDTFEPRSKILRPLEISPPIGAPPTLFQKRAARQKGISEEEFDLGMLRSVVPTNVLKPHTPLESGTLSLEREAPTRKEGSMLSRLNSSSCLDDNAGAASDDPTSVAASDDPTSVAAAWSAAPNPTYYAADAILEDPSWFLSSGGGGAHYADPFSFMEVGPAVTTMSAFSFDSSDPMPSSSDLMFSGFGSGLHDFNPMSFDTFEPRSKILRPLEISPPIGAPPIGAPPTLFQKRAARQKGISEEEFDDLGNIDVSGLNYDSDEAAPDKEDPLHGGKVTAGDGGSGKGGKRKGGKRKGLPGKNMMSERGKNMMSERRRRKELDDQLYMLRSVVPKISKMSKASILGDAIQYLEELLQRINDLRNELESMPSSSALPTPTASNFHPLTPTLPTLPSRVKEGLCPSSLPSSTGQPSVEVRVREGRAVKIHMLCDWRHGLLLSTMRALDSLGLDIQQAVISCFNGFALDVFLAEQSNDEPGALPEEIKAALLTSI